MKANALEWDEPAGKLTKIGIDEEAIKPENRIPRVTCANWCAGSDYMRCTGADGGDAGSTRAAQWGR